MYKKFIPLIFLAFSVIPFLAACSSSSTIQKDQVIVQTDSLNKAYGLLYYKEGLAMMASKRYNSCLKNFKLAKPHILNQRVFNRNDRATYFNAFGKAFFYLNQTDSAKYYFDLALDLNPKYVEVYNNLGYLAFLNKNVVRAIEYYKHALTLDPDYEIAKENIELVKAFKEGLLSWNAYGLFKEAENIQNLGEQIKIYTRLVQEFPLYTDAYNNLAVALYQNGEYQRALTLLEQLILIDNKYAMAHNNLGFLYMEMGFLSQATEEFLIAISLKEKFTMALINLSTAYMQQGEYNRAKIYMDRVLAYEPQNNEAWRILKLCEEMSSSE